MSGDLIAGYLVELRAGLRVPAAEAELILAEAEDHLRETAAVGMTVGMTELEAQQAAISSFGPVRAVVRAHHRRTATAVDAAVAVWKLTALLATTVGTVGLATVFLLWHSRPAGPPGIQLVPVARGPVLTALAVDAAMIAGGLALLATRPLVARRLARRGVSGRDLLSPAVKASFFLLASALLFALHASGVTVLTAHISWNTPTSSGSMTTAVSLVPAIVVVGCLAVAVGYGVQTAFRRTRRELGSGARARLPGSG
jgi:HAAS